MRQALTILFLFYFFALFGQTTKSNYEHVTACITERKWAELKELFQGVVMEDADEAATFFWKSLDIGKEGKWIMAWELGSYYKDKRDYDKACPFFAELNRVFPNDVQSLSIHAEMEVLRGKEREALELYEKILALDVNNLPANIFVGNYYYLQADGQKSTLESNFRKIQVPNKMQYANYRNHLEELLDSEYSKARICLQRVIAQFPSTEVKKTLDKIKTVEKEVNN